MNEIEIIRKIVEGDSDSYKLLVEQNMKSITKVCLNFVHNVQDAEELAQDTFVEAFYSLKNFKGNSSFSTWTYKIAVNKSIDFIRKSSRKKRIAQLIPFINLNNNDVNKLSEYYESPEKYFESIEKYNLIISAINKLPENQKIALTLSKLEGLTSKEISDIMDVSIASVDSLIQRAKKKLKIFLNDRDEFELK